MILKKILSKPKTSSSLTPKKPEVPSEDDQLSKNIDINLKSIQDIFAGTGDLVVREFKLGSNQEVKTFAVMIAGLVNEASVNENLIKPLMFINKNFSKNNAFMLVKESALSVGNVKESRTLTETIDSILSGDSAVFIDGSNIALVASIRGWKARGVDEPKTEVVVRGPREGFVESIATNMALVRRKIKNPDLKFELMKIGKYTKTDICIAYIKGIANEKIVQEVKVRLNRINTDAILESGYIESFIEDPSFSLFATVGNSEKPDVLSAKLLEGRVGILVDGTPFALTVPYLFVEAFQASEDYYSRPYYASLVRLFRWLGFFLSTFTPGLYVAITTFHQELLPPALLISIASAQEGTPFPALVEALLMQVVYEILREAGVRLPRPIGPAISIVGALVIGEAAVNAGLVGAPMVVIVALTAITSFITPSLSDVNTLVRFILLFLGGFAGLYGIMLGFIALVIHQCTLRSVGIPYMSPLTPRNLSDFKDVFIRAPWWAMFTRPKVLGSNNPVRQKTSLKPKPPEDN